MQYTQLDHFQLKRKRFNLSNSDFKEDSISTCFFQTRTSFTKSSHWNTKKINILKTRGPPHHILHTILRVMSGWPSNIKWGSSMGLPNLPNIPSVKFNHHIQGDLGSSGITVPQHGIHEVLQHLRKKLGSVYYYQSSIIQGSKLKCI